MSRKALTWQFVRNGAAALFGIVVLLFVAGCNGSSHNPMSSAGTELMVTSASVLVDGQPVNGQTFRRGFGAGSSTRFEAQLMTGDGTPAPGQMMWLEYDLPQAMGMGMGMGHHVGRIALYDDGTHGDRVAGDGLYCFEDLVGDYGCHGADAELGEYHYEFYGMHNGHETNHMMVSVTVVDS